MRATRFFFVQLGSTLLLAVSCCLAVATTARAETLTLDGCLREVVEKNPDIARQRHQCEVALGTRLTFRARALPQLSLGGGAGQQGKQQDEVLIDPRTGARVVNARPSRLFTILTGNASQPLFDFAIPASFRRGNLEVSVAVQNFYVTTVTVLHTARLQYVQAVFQRENEVQWEKINALLAENERNQRAAFQAGTVGRIATLQARLQEYGVEIAGIGAGGAQRTALLALLGLMGRDLGAADATANVRLAGTLAELAGGDLDFDPQAAADEALRRRPDIELARQSTASAREDVRIARGGYYPQLRLVADGTLIPQNAVRSSQQAIRPGDDIRTTEVRYGGSFNWTIIDTGAVLGSVRTARAIGETFDIRRRELEAGVPRDLAKLRSAWRNAAARRRALQTARAEASDVLDAVTKAVASGTGTQTDFLFAQNDLTSNRLGLLNALFAEANARAEFDRITGGYLRFVPSEKPAAEK